MTSLRLLQLGALTLYAIFATTVNNISAQIPETILVNIIHPAYPNVSNGDTVVFECNALPVLTTKDVDFDGGCNNTAQLSFTESVTVLESHENGWLSIMGCTFTAIDSCGNQGSITVHVVIQDTTPPLLEGVPENLALPSGIPIPSVAYVYALDNCTQNPEVDFQEFDQSTSDSIIYARVWSSTDDAGNKSTKTQRISQPIERQVDPCAEVALFPVSETSLAQGSCNADEPVCIFTTGTFSGTLSLNGQPLQFTGCETVAGSQYALGNLTFTTGEAYETIWRVGAGVHRARITTSAELLALFKAEAPAGEWTLSAENELIGRHNPRFKNLQFVHVPTGDLHTIGVEEVNIQIGIATVLPKGTSTLILTTAEGCSNELTVHNNCTPVREQQVTVIQGYTAAHCFNVNGEAEDYIFEIIEAEYAGIVDFQAVNPDGCFEFSANLIGVEKVLVEYCHKLTGSCEQILLVIEVFNREGVKPPNAIADLVAVAYNGQQMARITANDEVVGGYASVTLFTEKTKGTARLDAQNRLHYDAPKDWCGNDQVSYEICNAAGCDSATVKIQVTCEDLIVFNGFSPNNDGINDHFTVLGIENYTENTLVIFNQHGHEVYQAQGYENDWDGTYRGTALVDGTYYFVLTVKGKEPNSGYVQIAR